jgi:hypothetical protein
MIQIPSSFLVASERLSPVFWRAIVKSKWPHVLASAL